MTRAMEQSTSRNEVPFHRHPSVRASFRFQAEMCDSDRASLNLYRNRALEHRYRNHQQFFIFYALQDSFHTEKRAALNTDPRTDGEVFARSRRQAVLCRQPDPFDLCLIERLGFAAEAQNFQDARSRNNGSRTWAERVKPAEYVTGEQWRIDFFESVRPSTAAAVNWSQNFVALCCKQVWNYEVMTVPNLQSKPRQT